MIRLWRHASKMRKHHAHNASDTVVRSLTSEFAIFCNGIASSLYQLYPKRSRQNESNIGVWSNMVPSWIICTMGQSPGRQVGRGGTQWDLKSTNIFVFFQVSANFCQLFMSIFEKSLLWSFVSFFISFLVLQGREAEISWCTPFEAGKKDGSASNGWLASALGHPKEAPPVIACRCANPAQTYRSPW